jgi:hypothetical protein
VQQDNVDISGEYAVIQNDTLLIAVKEFLWTSQPEYLPDSYTTFFIKIQNRTKKPIKVNYNDFYVIDQVNLQYDIVEPVNVLDMMLQDTALIPDRFSITAETQRENASRIYEIRKNITGKSFNFGEIMPGAFKEGVLFFPKLNNRNMEFRFIYKSNEIKFLKSK